MISICIPVYEMGGEGVRFLRRCLESIRMQSCQDYETIVSDHSVDDKIERACAPFARVRYLRNPHKRGNSSANLNNAINHARGEHIKIIFQDDFLSGPQSLARIRHEIGDRPWLAHSYWHTDIGGRSRFKPTKPFMPDQPEGFLRLNSIGAPTALMFKRNDLRFDENLVWVMDCEFYFQMARAFGAGVIVPEPLAVQTLWPGQLTHILSDQVKNAESAYLERLLLSTRPG